MVKIEGKVEDKLIKLAEILETKGPEAPDIRDFMQANADEAEVLRVTHVAVFVEAQKAKGEIPPVDTWEEVENRIAQQDAEKAEEERKYPFVNEIQCECGCGAVLGFMRSRELKSDWDPTKAGFAVGGHMDAKRRQ